MAENFLDRICTAYSKHLHIPEDNKLMLDYTATLVLAGTLEKLEDKPWGWLEGPPASGKTETIMRFYKWADPKNPENKRSLFLDDLTEHALVSCYVDPDDPDRDASALALLNNKCLIVKDCASLTTKSISETQKLFGDLTGIYDGTFTKFGGIRGKQTYATKMSVLLCTTPLPEEIRRVTQSIGERFLSFEIDRIPKASSERIEDVVRAIQKSGSKAMWRNELDELVCEQMQKAYEFADENIEEFEIPDFLVLKISKLADFVARLRSISRVGVATTPESGRRLGCQLAAFGVIRGLLCGRTIMDESDVGLLQRIAFDTVPRAQKKLFLYLWANKEAVTKESLVMNLNFSDKLATALSEQFKMSGFLECDLRSKTRVKSLKMNDETRQIVRECGFLLGSPFPILETKG